VTSGLTVGPWLARHAVDETSAAAQARQSDEFPLSWAEGALRNALCRSPSFEARPYEIFGQGSRVNNTYIDHASDVDLVLMLKMPFESNVDAFNQCTMDNLTGHDAAGHYGWEEFRDDVCAALAESFVVRMGRRCVNLDDSYSLMGEMVDILLATEYRLYSALPVSGVEPYEEGVFFRDRDGRPIVNFPKRHQRNGDEKDMRTGGRFKEVVRALKCVRRLAERERVIADGAAPSYLLECLLYNVPDNVYRTSSLWAAYHGALEWLWRRHCEDPVSFGDLPCQNGINRLFGDGPDQWEAGDTARIIGILHEL
jgi:hypothetical protein